MAEITWKGYLELLDGLTKTLERLTGVEELKTAAASRGDLPGVEDCMKQEQAISLSLRNFDIRREKMLAGLGLEGVNLSGLPDRAPQELRLEVKAAAERLRQQYSVFQAASEVARNTLECNLRAIEQLQAQRMGDDAQAKELRNTRQTDFRA